MTTRSTAALVGRGALHDVHAALLLIGEPLAGTLPRKSLGLYVHLGGVALSLENARLANNLCLVERGKVILEGLDAVEREVIQRKAEGVKVSREPLLKQRRELAEIRRDLEDRDAPLDDDFARRSGTYSRILARMKEVSSSRVYWLRVPTTLTRNLRAWSGGETRVILLDVHAKEAIGTHVNVDLLLWVLDDDGIGGAPLELIHVVGIDEVDHRVECRGAAS